MRKVVKQTAAVIKKSVSQVSLFLLFSLTCRKTPAGIEEVHGQGLTAGLIDIGGGRSLSTLDLSILMT
jgi:hypothetical protein